MTFRAISQLVTHRNSCPCPHHFRTPPVYTPKLPISTVPSACHRKYGSDTAINSVQYYFGENLKINWYIPIFCLSINKLVTYSEIQWLWNLKARTDQNCCSHSTGRFCTPSCILSGASTNSSALNKYCAICFSVHDSILLGKILFCSWFRMSKQAEWYCSCLCGHCFSPVVYKRKESPLDTRAVQPNTTIHTHDNLMEECWNEPQTTREFFFVPLDGLSFDGIAIKDY